MRSYELDAFDLDVVKLALGNDVDLKREGGRPPASLSPSWPAEVNVPRPRGYQVSGELLDGLRYGG